MLSIRSKNSRIIKNWLISKFPGKKQTYRDMTDSFALSLFPKKSRITKRNYNDLFFMVLEYSTKSSDMWNTVQYFIQVFFVIISSFFQIGITTIKMKFIHFPLNLNLCQNLFQFCLNYLKSLHNLLQHIFIALQF